MRTSAGVTYLHGDHLGSASLTTGATSNSARYLPFGGTRWESGVATDTLRGFTGQRLDSTGLMFYNARYYDANIGRFISADIVVPGAGNPQSLNRYAYTFNNPIKYTDPSGHCPWCVTVALGALAGAAIGGVSYLINAATTGRFQADQMGAAVLLGVAGGALLGTGIAAPEGIGMLGSAMLIGAGTGALSTQAGYTMSSQDKFDVGDMALNTTIGGIAGAATANPVMSAATKIGIGAVSSIDQYALTQMNHGNSPTPEGLVISAGLGTVAAGVGEGLKMMSHNPQFTNDIEVRPTPNRFGGYRRNYSGYDPTAQQTNGIIDIAVDFSIGTGQNFLPGPQ